MKKCFQVTEHIAQTPEKVWTQLIDFENAGNWMPGIDELISLGDEQVGKGTILKFGARGKEHTTQITAFDIGKKLELTSVQGGVTAKYEYLITPDKKGTNLTLSAHCIATGFWWVLLPLISFAMKMSDSSQVKNLKTIIEQHR